MPRGRSLPSFFVQQASRDAAVRQKIVAGLEEKLRTDPGSLVANKGYSRAGGMEIDYAKIEREEKRLTASGFFRPTATLPRPA